LSDKIIFLSQFEFASMQEKSNSRRTPLSQLNNSLPSPGESGYGSQEGSLITSFKNQALRNDEKSNSLKQTKETPVTESVDTEGEYVKTLKKALKEALEENDLVLKYFKKTNILAQKKN